MSTDCLAAAPAAEFIPCTARALPPDLLVPAAQTAAAINPANSPLVSDIVKLILRLLGVPGLAAKDVEPLIEPEHIAVLTTKWWGAAGVRLSVGFMEQTDPELARKILAYMNKWSARGANVAFALTGSPGSADVRISRAGDGYWSYLGTDIKHIPAGQPTMNLQDFSLQTPDSEFDRVVCHETGHTLGCPHEHMRQALVARLNRAATIAYFSATQGWSAQEVVQQVLTPLSEASLMATPADQDSIMCYQIPAVCTNDGQPIRGGAVINDSDFALIGKIYPGKVAPPPPPPPGGHQQFIIRGDNITITPA